MARHLWRRWNTDHAETAKEFEQRTGARNIAGHWNFPAGETAEQIEADLNEVMARQQKRVLRSYTNQDLKSFFRKVANGKLEDENWETYAKNKMEELVALNPELKRISYDPENPWQTVDFLADITSGFNADDIQFFINTSDDDQKVIERYEATRNLANEISHDLGWIPSPETTQKIYTFFDRQQNLGQSRPKEAPQI